MHRGYIKLWRKALDTGWVKNHKLWAFWSYCLLKATHKDHEVIVGFQRVQLRAGQFVFGRKVASIETGLSEQEIRTVLKHLEKLGNLTINSTNKYSVLTIENWADYQCDLEISTNNPTCTQPASNQQVTTYKNEKNIRTKEEKILYLEKVLLTSDEYTKLVEQFGEVKANEFMQRLNDYIQSVGKKYRSHYHTILNWARREQPKPEAARLAEKHQGILNWVQRKGLQNGQ